MMKRIALAVVITIASFGSAYAVTNCTTSCYTIGNQRICNTSCF